MCPLLTALFLFLSLSRRVTFLPEGVIIGFRNFEWGFKSQKKIRFGVKKKFGKKEKKKSAWNRLKWREN
jgi:hypothetical protein